MGQSLSQKGVFAPSMRQPVQLSISGVIGTPFSFVHNAAVFSRRALSLVIVAILASQAVADELIHVYSSYKQKDAAQTEHFGVHCV